MRRISVIAAAIVFASIFVNPAYAYQLYFGDLHSHTGFSDGKGLPEDAYDMARYKAKLDFWTVSDHVEQLGVRKDLPPGAPEQTEWDAIREAADKKTEEGKFVAFAGFEWATDWSQGHANVINANEITTANNSFPLRRFYAWLSKRPDALMGFNHPNEESDQKKVFDHFAYVPSVASQTVYIATNIPLDFPFYYMALDNGWRVAPSGQQDNHSTNWGLDSSGNLTAVYADSLTRASLLEAFRSRRFYATNDRNLRLWLAGNGMPMGSSLAADKVDLDIEVKNESGGEIASVKLITNGGKVLKEWTPGQAEFKEHLTVTAEPGAKSWFLVLAQESQNDKFAISAPIFLMAN